MIKLFKLELTNFMCISQASLDFTDSKVILLIGENGNGKSSVLDAVSLCLNETKRADTFKDYVKYGTEHGKVILNAEIDGEKIDFNISLHATNTPNMERVVNYKGREYKNSEVSTLLQSLNISTYADIIMSSQGEGDITKLTPAKRGDYLKSLLSFDFTTQVESCKNKVDEIKKNIDFNTHQITFNNNAVTSKLSEIREVQPCPYTSEQLTQLETDVSNLSADARTYSITLGKKDGLLKEISELQRQIFTLQQNIDNTLHSKDTTQVSINLIQENIKGLENLKNSLIEDTSSLERLKTQLESIDDKELLIEKDNALKEYTLASSDKKHAEQHLVLIEKGICPECGHNFDDNDVAKYNNMLETATKKEKDANIKITNISEQLNNINVTKAELNKEIYSLNANISLKNKQISELEYKASSITKLQESIANVDNIVSDLKIQKESLETSLGTKQLELSTLEEKLKLLTEKSTELTQKMSLLTNVKEAISTNRFIVENNKKIQESIDLLKNEVSKCEESLESQRKEKAVYDSALEILQKNFPTYLVIKTCEKLELEMNKFIQIVFPTMEVKLFQNKKGVEFFYTLNKDDGKDHSKQNLISVKMASGFEKAAISLAFKVSLCRAYGMTFSFLDEVDSAGSERNSENLFKSLIINDWFDQLFIVSHKPSVRDVICSITDAKTYYVKNGEFTLDE